MTNSIESKETRSKVCTLGNRLSRTLGRGEAFILAWRLVRAGQVEIRVAGVSFGRRQEALRRLATYNPADVRAFIVPEPENPADHNAVAVKVMVQGGKGLFHLGYVPTAQTGTAQALMGHLPRIKVLVGNVYGARLCIGV